MVLKSRVMSFKALCRAKPYIKGDFEAGSETTSLIRLATKKRVIRLLSQYKLCWSILVTGLIRVQQNTRVGLCLEHP